MHNLSKNVKITQVITPTDGAAAQTAINSDSVDMSGFESVLFVVTTGAITATAVTSINAAQSADDITFADLLGTGQSIAVAEAEDIFYIDVVKPIDRYVRLEVARATADAVISSCIAYQYGTPSARKTPTTHGSTVNGELHVSPAEGTA